MSPNIASIIVCIIIIFCARSIYDDQPNAHVRFMEKLDARIRNHDREIEKMCNFHHQGFVDAITELLKVRTDAEKLMVSNGVHTTKFQDATILKCDHSIRFSMSVVSVHPSIHTFSSTYPRSGCGGSILSRETQTSLTPTTSASSSQRDREASR